MQFKFPQSLQNLQAVSDTQQVRQKIRMLLSSQNIETKYKIILRKTKYIYASCSSCSAFLRWRFDVSSSKFILIKANTSHNHQIKQHWVQNRLRNFISLLPEGISLRDAKKVTTSQLQISQSMFYYHYNKLKNPSVQFKDLINAYLQSKYQIQMDPYDSSFTNIPDLLILVSPRMKQNYLKYGHSVSYDLTYNLIKEHHNSQKKYKLGCILGHSISRKIVPFALTITIDETKQKMYEIFKAFGDIMGKMPEIIVSDQSPSLKAALTELQGDREFDGIHCWDSFHVLKNVKKRLSNIKNLKYFSHLIKITDSEAFQTYLKEVYEELDQSDIPVLSTFIHNSHNYCYSQIRQRFVGLSLSDGINQKFHDLLKEKIPFQLTYAQVLNKTVKFLQVLGQRSEIIQIQKTPIQKWIDIPCLKELRCSLDKSVFAYVGIHLKRLVHIDIITDDPFSCYDRESQSTYQIQIIENVPRCTCRYMQKSGLMCAHIIKLMAIRRFNITSLVHQRWRIKSQNLLSVINFKKCDKKIKRVCRGRKSRRNMIK